MYLDSAKSRKERAFLIEVNDFVNNSDYRKFYPRTKSRHWFIKNYQMILQIDNVVCKKAIEQYEEYIKKEKLSFKDRIYEFVSDSRINKFSINFPVFFSDGISMGVWLACNYDKVSSSKLEL